MVGTIQIGEVGSIREAPRDIDNRSGFVGCDGAARSSGARAMMGNPAVSRDRLHAEGTKHSRQRVGSVADGATEGSRGSWTIFTTMAVALPEAYLSSARGCEPGIARKLEIGTRGNFAVRTVMRRGNAGWGPESATR